MPKYSGPGLPSDIMEFLRGNPEEQRRVRWRMKELEDKRTQVARVAEEVARRATLPLKKCTALPYTNCQNMTPGGFICEDCAAEYRSDPDAFK